jgi:hypothetical protein
LTFVLAACEKLFFVGFDNLPKSSAAMPESVEKGEQVD